MTTLDPLLVQHRDVLPAIARRRGLTNVRAFGSVARGEARADSDVDLIVEMLPGTTGLALGGLLVDAEQLLGRRVDLRTAAALAPAMRARVLREAVLL